VCRSCVGLVVVGIVVGVVVLVAVGGSSSSSSGAGGGSSLGYQLCCWFFGFVPLVCVFTYLPTLCLLCLALAPLVSEFEKKIACGARRLPGALPRDVGERRRQFLFQIPTPEAPEQDRGDTM